MSITFVPLSLDKFSQILEHNLCGVWVYYPPFVSLRTFCLYNVNPPTIYGLDWDIMYAEITLISHPFPR